MSCLAMATSRPTFPRAAVLPAALLWILALPTAAGAELRISNLSVFLNDFDVTVQVVLLGAIPSNLHESLQTGITTHVRLEVELWQYNRFLADRRLTGKTIERQITYNVLTKEYKVVSAKGEQREPYLTKDLREAQRVISEVRVGNLAPASSLSPRDLYYVRVRSDVSLGGVNSWFARFAGEAEETDWVRSGLLTVSRTQ
jgi:Domain of unknown function (DUF4390)